MKKPFYLSILTLSIAACSYETSPNERSRGGIRNRAFDVYTRNDTAGPNNSMNSNTSTDQNEDPRNGNGKGSGM